MKVIDLRCERLVEPIGLDARHPRLTWRIDAEGATGVVQEAYQLEVDGGWDTGRVSSWRQQVTYDGPALASRQVVRWRVRVWTSAGDSEWSDWATFEVGVLDGWAATMLYADQPATPVVRFAKRFEVPDDIASARLRLSAHGIVCASIDGADVGDEVLAPGWTSYNHRLIVRTYDVTDLVGPGDHELALTVGPGWYSGRIGFRDAAPLYGTTVGAFAQLEIERADHSRVLVGTDDSWSATTTNYTLAEIYDGEDIDHAVERQPVTVTLVDMVGYPGTQVAPPVPPVRRTQTLKPVSVNGNILDFGQNLVGGLRVRGIPADTTVTLRHAEILDNNGQLFTAALRTARATDVITGPREYEPRFTFHGFRYAEITGVDLEQVDVEAVVIHSDLERIGTFECSDPLLNRLHENVVWGWRGNSVSVPTDCPQRDERLGWTGDAQVFSPTASFLFDAETFWENWLADLAADQRDNGAVPSVVPDIGLDIVGACGWGDAAVIVPWTTYVAYGDDTVLRDALPSMRASVDYVYSRLDDDHRWTQDFQYGDWVDPDAPTEQPWRAKAKFDLVATAYAAHVADLLARAATILGDHDLAAASRARFDTVRAAWWQHYGEAAATTQTGAALAIAFDLVPDDEARFKMGEALALRVHDADDHLSTGFLGTPLLLPSLAATGHLDVAYDVLLQQTAPSWLYTVLAGGTTIWERWDALRPDGSVAMGSLDLGGSGGSMVSFNHYAFGAIAEWMHTTIAGLRPDPDDPGYHHFFVEPRPGGGLTHASASLQTRYGRASVAWRIENDTLRVDVEVPPNTSATVTLPGDAPRTVGSGSHTF